MADLGSGEPTGLRVGGLGTTPTSSTKVNPKLSCPGEAALTCTGAGEALDPSEVLTEEAVAPRERVIEIRSPSSSADKRVTASSSEAGVPIQC